MVVRIVPLCLAICCLPTGGGAQTKDAATVQKFCIPDDKAAEDLAGKSPLEVLEAANRLLDSGRPFEANESVATFGSMLPAEPAFSVSIAYNDLVVAQRGYLFSGGTKCEAWRKDAGTSSNCNWSSETMPPIDLSAEYEDSKIAVSETLVLQGNKLTLRSDFSGLRDPIVKTFSCTDRSDIMRYFRQP